VTVEHQNKRDSLTTSALETRQRIRQPALEPVITSTPILTLTWGDWVHLRSTQDNLTTIFFFLEILLIFFSLEIGLTAAGFDLQLQGQTR
jgi:hypothetical protein